MHKLEAQKKTNEPREAEGIWDTSKQKTIPLFLVIIYSSFYPPLLFYSLSLCVSEKAKMFRVAPGELTP